MADQLSSATMEKNRCAAELELERNPMPTIVTNALGVVTLWNAKAAITTGYYREEMLGMELAEVVTGDSMKEEVREGVRVSVGVGAASPLYHAALPPLPAPSGASRRPRFATLAPAKREERAGELWRHPVHRTELHRALALPRA